MSNATIVASFDGRTPTDEVIRNWDAIREDYDRERELAAIDRIMRQRTGVRL